MIWFLLPCLLGCYFCWFPTTRLLLLFISNNTVATSIDFQQTGCYFCWFLRTRLLLLLVSYNTVAFWWFPTTRLLLLLTFNKRVATSVDFKEHGCYFCWFLTTRLLLLLVFNNMISSLRLKRQRNIALIATKSIIQTYMQPRPCNNRLRHTRKTL